LSQTWIRGKIWLDQIQQNLPGGFPQCRLHKMSDPIWTFESSQFEEQFPEAAHIIQSASACGPSRSHPIRTNCLNSLYIKYVHPEHPVSELGYRTNEIQQP
jgi:hypothetical protein